MNHDIPLMDCDELIHRISELDALLGTAPMPSVVRERQLLLKEALKELLHQHIE